eukprot:g6853.t1
MLGDESTGQYQRTRIRHAKRLVAEYLNHLESLAEKAPDEAELLRREKERLAALVVGRRQREAKLVGEFDSDEIYDPDDEGVLSMREAQQESRRRIRALCVGRKLADCTNLLIDDLIRELQTFMTRQDDEHSWEHTATGSGKLPDPDIVFKCVDAERAVVVGSTVDQREERFIGNACSDEISTQADSDKQPLQDHFSPSFDETEESKKSNIISRPNPHGHQHKRDAHRVASASGTESTATEGHPVPVAGDRKRERNAEDDDQHPTLLRTMSRKEAQQQPSLSPPSPTPGAAVASLESAQGTAAEAVRPQVLVPLTGAGDSGCIGMIGIQGFTTRVLVDDDSWRDWFMKRMKPLNRGENRNAKRLRLVRPRGLPDKGRLEHVPTGIAAKVVYGSIEKISLKRGMPVYAVSWEDGLMQLDVPKKYMRQFIAEDDARAGKGIPLTADVVQHLTWIGSTVGPVLDEVRKAIYLNSLSKVTLAEDARHRDVVEQALRSLVECLPSIDTAEVWQLDSNGSIRCVQGLAAAGEGHGKIFRSNERVNNLLDDEDVEDLCLKMKPVAVGNTSGEDKEAPNTGSIQGKSEQKPIRGTQPKPTPSVHIPEGLVIRPKRSSGILAAAPFRDYSFKVGRSWIGADRLARGFALVLRENVKKSGRSGTAIVNAEYGHSGGGIDDSPQRGGRSKSGAVAAEVATDYSVHGHIEDGDFTARVAREVGKALACVRGRERRAAIRVQALKKLSEVCLNSKPSGKEAKEAVLAEISVVLPGCRAYIGVLQPGGRTVLYESATANSAMKGRELRRGEGNRVGVLGVDGWSDVELGRPEEVHPEKAVVNFLREAGSLLANALYTERRSSEDGDIWLLSEMCRKLEVGFMAIASREQRALSRAKALDRVLNCCKGFNVAAATSSVADSGGVAAGGGAGGRKANTAGRPTVEPSDEGGVARAVHTTSTTNVPFPSAARSQDSQSHSKRAAQSILNGGGKTATKHNTERAAGASASIEGPSSSPGVDATAGSMTATSLSPEAPIPSESVMSAAATALVEEEKANDLIFSAPVQPPTSAETSDGRKGVLVTLKDARLAVLVHQGDKRVAVVELPGGRQQVLPESEVVPGQSVFLRSGREALLVETVENSNAMVVVGTGGKANVVEETAKGQLTKLPLSVLKDFEAVAALAAGEGPPGAVSGAELVKQVIAAAQWVLPQVDIYVGNLSPFGESLNFAIGSSRSNASGKRIYRFEDPWADEETVLGHPEKDVLSYLETCASALGLALDLEAKICALRTLRSVTAEESGGASANDSGILKNRVVEGGGGSRNNTATVSSAQEVYAAVTAALSRALVHCKRFEVWEAIQPRDELGRFFLEPSRAGQPPPFHAEDGDTREFLKLQITHCTGLAQADRFGLSDPLCIVKWPRNGEEFGRTPTIYNTVHPVWKASYFELPLAAPAAGATVASATGAGSGHLACRRRGGKESGGAGGEEGEMEDETLELTVQVWDEDDGVPADFLGELQFDAQALLDMARDRRDLVLPLEARHDGSMAKKQRKQVQGSVGLRVSPATDGALNRLQELIDAKKVFLEVVIQGSLGLRQGEGACLFAVATFDGKEVGKTASQGGEDLTTADDGDSTEPSSDFSITVWNRVQERGRSQRIKCVFVGRVDMSVAELVKCSKEVEGVVRDTMDAKTMNKTQQIPLKDMDGNYEESCVLVLSARQTSPSEWRAGLAEATFIGDSYSDAASVEASGLKTVFDRRVRLTVLRATGLAQADDNGSADAMCVLRRRGREVGRTTTIYGSLEPVWGTKIREGESFLLTIPHPREAAFGGGGIVLEVFDEDFGDPNEFLGQVTITGEELLHFHSPGTFKGSDAQNRQASLQKKPEVPQSDQWLVQGDLLYRLEGVDNGDEESEDFVVVDLPRILDRSLQSVEQREEASVPPQSSQYRRIEIRVMEARGLAKADRFGLSDPYVVIYANGQTELGRTRTIRLSLEPMWTNPEERFVVAVGFEDAAKCDLTLEVWDDDHLRQGDFLGQVSLPKVELLEYNLPTGPIECELEKKKSATQGFNELVQGVLTFSMREAHGDMPDEPAEGEDSSKRGDFLGQASVGWAGLELLPGEASRELNLTLGYRDDVPKRDQELVQGTIQMLVEAPVVEAKIGDGVARSYIVTVDRAWGLAKADRFGKADPFVSVKVNRDGDEDERGRTRSIAGTLQPVWRNPPEMFILTAVEELILEVWDMDLLKKGEFLGEARLSLQHLAEQVPVDGAHEFTAVLQPKSSGTDNFNRLVQGSLRFTCQISVPLEPTEVRQEKGSPGTPKVEVVVEILDAGAGESITAPTTIAGTRNGLIGRVVLGERALRLPEPGDGPPCKVLELPIELPTSTATNAVAKRRGKHVASGVSSRRKRPAAIIMFLERVPSPTHSSQSQDAKASSAWQHGAPSTQMTPAATVAVPATAQDTAATAIVTAIANADCKNLNAEGALTAGPTASTMQTPILPLEEQTLAKGHILFSLFPWHDFDYAGELDKSNASRGLQVQVRLVGATNLTEPSASIFATFSFRGTVLAKTTIVKPTQPQVPTGDVESQETETASGDSGGFSHVWSAQHSSSTCTVPLPEECVERRETEIEIDLWEQGGPENDHGDHLGQRSHGSTSNLAARGSLSFQLWLRRGGESLASEFIHSAVTVEVLAAKGLPHGSASSSSSEARRRVFCVVKEDGIELGRTQASEITHGTRDHAILAAKDGEGLTTTSGVSLPEMVSWEGGSHDDTNRFAVTLSPHRGGGLPLQLTVELWEVTSEDGDENATRGRRKTNMPSLRAGKGHSARRIGSARVGPDTLLLSLPGRLTLPLEICRSNPKDTIGKGNGIGNGGRAARSDEPAEARTTGSEASTPKIVLRVTPEVGVHWGRRVKAAAAAAKRVNALPSTGATSASIAGRGPSASTALENGSNGLANVVYMTNAEGDDKGDDPGNIVAAEPPREDELFVRMVAAEAEGLLRGLRASDMRAEQRRIALARVREICNAWSQARTRTTASQHQTGTFSRDISEEEGDRRKGLAPTNVQEVAGDSFNGNGDGDERRGVSDGGAGYSGDEAERVEEGDGEEDEDDDHLASAPLIPKVFDYEGRVGWPFVCVPLEGFLRSSSIGVLGFDTFEQIGNSGSSGNQPEAGVVHMVQEAASVLGDTICCDRRRSALHTVAQSCLSFRSSVIDVLIATAKAAEEAVTSSSRAEVWKIDPSDGSLYVVTKRLPDPTESLRLAGEPAMPQQLKVEVTAAELLPAITDYYETSPSAAAGPVRAIRSVAVRISTAGDGTRSTNSAFRTSPFALKPLARSCSPQWYEGHRRLRVSKDGAVLRAEIIAKVEQGSRGRAKATSDISKGQRQSQQKAPQAEGLLSSRGRRGLAELGDDELILAFASMDVNAVRDGYNYIQLFSPESLEDDGNGSNGTGVGEDGNEDAATALSARPMGQLVLRLSWVEPGGGCGENDEAGGGAGHTTLVIHGASGLAKADFLGDSDPYCIVKWGGIELGRTKTCPNTLEPDWGKERFRLALPAEDTADKRKHLPLVLEVWDEDTPGTNGDFLGQVVLQADKIDAPAPGTRGILLSKKPAAELKLSKQKLVQGMIEFSLETPRTAAAAEATSSGAGAGDGVTPSDTKKRDTSETSTERGGQGTKEGDRSSADSVVGEAKKMQSLRTNGKPATPEKPAGSSFWAEKTDNAGSTSEQSPVGLQKRKSNPPAHATAAATSKEKAGDIRGTEEEWQGDTWDEGDIPEVESLGSVSASLTGAGSTSLGSAGSITLGTIELASKHEDSAESQDVLICLKGVTGLREADRYGSSDPKGYVSWNGETAGSTSTIYNSTDPCWNPDEEKFHLRLPLDRSLCQLHIDVWDMDFAGTRKGDFLGRATVPTVTLLHPPPGGREAPITIPLLPPKGPMESGNVKESNGRGDVTAESDDGVAVSAEATNASSQNPAALSDNSKHLQGGSRGTERFAARLMHNVQKHLRMDETITGTLTVSVELFQYDDEAGALVTGVRETGAPPALGGYATAKFKVAEDAAEAKRRREREGIRVPQMLSRVTELHDRLKGSVVTGPASAGFSDMTEGAAAVIPEVLAGQILSLARRGSRGLGYTVLTASRDDPLARDRLVVLLEPILAAGHGRGGDDDLGCQGSREVSSATRPADQGVRRPRQRQQVEPDDLAATGADERPRHALVLPCVPGQISKEDITVATELARAADEAGRAIQRRRRRQLVMDRCAEHIEELCRSRKQSYEGLYNDVMRAMKPVCFGAGAEVDCPLRDMPAILSILSCGGYRLRVEASSPGWSMNAGHQRSAAPVASAGAEGASLCSAIGGIESFGRWSGPLPMASGLVKRAVDRGDIFLVIENTVYVANVSWSRVWQETMPHKHVSSSSALKTSVALLREGIGRDIADAFVLAPLWVPDVGCIGLITIADIPYTTLPQSARGGGRQRKPASHLHHQQHGRGEAPSGRTPDGATRRGRQGVDPYVRHAVGPGVVEFARRVGVALGTAAFHLRKKFVIARTKAAGARYSLHCGKGIAEHNVSQRLLLSSPPPPLRQAGQAVCDIYSAAIASFTEGLPWIRAADVWHVSSIPEHEAVFTPEPIDRPKVAGDANAAGADTESLGTLTVDSSRTDNTDGGDGARFRERVVGRTWSGHPAVVLRSLRVPGRGEAARTARWLRANGEDGRAVFGDDQGWTDQRLRLLAEEWKVCTAGGGGDRGPGSGSSGGQPSAASGTSPRSQPRPFLLHTGHLVVPFRNGCLREKSEIAGTKEVVGHGVVLAVDRGVDWRRWEPHLVETAAVAMRCLERLERDGEVAMRRRVRRWKEDLVNAQTRWYTGDDPPR